MFGIFSGESMHNEEKINNKAGCNVRIRPAFFIAAIAVIAVLVSGVTGCSTKLLESDPETVAALSNVFDEASYYLYDEEAEVYTVYDAGKSQIGYAFYAEGMGEGIPAAEGLEKYAGPIVILVGLDDAETVRGIFVVSHSETETFWVLLVNNDYAGQFVGISIEDVRLARFGGQIDGVTGATLSSLLVLNTVKNTIQEKLSYIEGGAQ